MSMDLLAFIESESIVYVNQQEFTNKMLHSLP